MRKLMLFVALVAACSKAETPKADSTPPAPPPPAKLTPADVAGTWTGTSKLAGTDSVVNKWTATRVSDSSGTLMIEGAKDPVPFTTTFDADSMMNMSAPYADPKTPKVKVTFHSIGRLKDGKLVGTTAIHLAAKPDSIVARTTWEATKAP